MIAVKIDFPSSTSCDSLHRGILGLGAELDIRGAMTMHALIARVGKQSNNETTRSLGRVSSGICLEASSSEVLEALFTQRLGTYHIVKLMLRALP